MNSKLWIAPLALAAVVACRNLLNEEPQSFVTSDSFFQTEADLKSGVIAAYSPMSSAPTWSSRMRTGCSSGPTRH